MNTKSDDSTLSSTTFASTKRKMDRIQFTALLPPWLCQYCDTVTKVINNLLLFMGFCNFCLFTLVFRSTMLPNLGVSPTFLSFLLCCQNLLTWFALNNHRMSSLPTLVANEFVIGCLLGLSVGGSIVGFVLSQFFGRISNCVKITMLNYEFECNNVATMKSIWFWAGLICWLNTSLSILICYGRDELSYLEHQSYENIGLALEELQSSFERNAVYTQAPGDGSFFGNRTTTATANADHETLGDAQFLTTPTQEASLTAATRNYSGYGAESGFDDPQQSSDTATDAKILLV